MAYINGKEVLFSPTVNIGLIAKEYESIVYNEDNTVTLVEKSGKTRTALCEYSGNKLVAVTFTDTNETIYTTYNGANLTNIGDTALDLANARTTYHTKPSMTVESGVAQVLNPIPLEVQGQIISSTMSVEASVVIESEE